MDFQNSVSQQGTAEDSQQNITDQHHFEENN